MTNDQCKEPHISGGPVRCLCAVPKIGTLSNKVLVEIVKRNLNGTEFRQVHPVTKTIVVYE